MKKIPLFALLLCLTAVSAFSQNAGYPGMMNNGTFLLNGGIGFGQALTSKVKLTPLTITGDSAIPFFSLPFTFGFALGFSTEDDRVSTSSKTENWSSSNIALGLRLAYHINWNLKKLDTYVLLTMGDILAWETYLNSVDNTKNKRDDLHQIFWFGLGAGARYYFVPRFGVYSELTLGNFYNFTFGVCTKM
jgi:hypothetical protein